MSARIDKADNNLRIETTLEEKDICYFDVRKEPFKVYGLYDYKNEPVFKRLPDAIAKATNEKVDRLYLHTAGGRVRFSTNSRYIAIKAVMPEVTYYPHMPLTGTSGFDLYIDTPSGSTYYKTFKPPFGMKDGYESIIYFSDEKERYITVNFPLYNSLNDLYIGVQKNSWLDQGMNYRYAKPVLYYGSSITQGGCASRPGNSYQSIISRRLNCDFINLGFSGSARGEDVIADYMSDLDISVFVCDYDHNAPNAEHLQATHERLFRKFRDKQKHLPVIFISRPDFEENYNESVKRRDIIYTTYMSAIRNGDANVFYIDGYSLFKDEYRDCCTVDGSHPNDAGFLRMAEVIGFTVHQALKKTTNQ